MNEPKSFASLTPSLLARKGAARPAMRPQIQPMQQFHEATARQMHEDLGWNDMGHDIDAPQEAARAPAQPAQIVPIGGSEPAPMPVAAPVPEVVRQREAIALSLTPPPVHVEPIHAEAPAEPAPVEHAPVQAAPIQIAPAPMVRAPALTASRRSALADGRRAAFTLRLDADRHLKLRLACTVNNRSAQQVVTDALDRLLSEMPDVAALASNVRKRG